MLYRNPSLPLAERALDLLARMTLAEKTSQLVGILPQPLLGADGVTKPQLDRHLAQGIGHIAGVGIAVNDPVGLARLNNDIQKYLRESTRLGIPAILHNEALNGLLAQGYTSFPTAIGLAATWNPAGIREMADLTRRQMLSIGIRQGLAPVLDVARDARWGRVHETYGEEVLLVSAMGVAFVQGLQGDDLREGVLATAKHFLGYSMTEAGQNLAATQLGNRELYDVYATPFEAAIRLAGLRSVMNSYSEIDGEPVATSSAVLSDLLRDKMGFEGTVVSDYRTIQYLVERQRVAATAQEAGAMAVSAGLDVELPSAYGFGPALADAVSNGIVDEAVVDRAVLRVLTHKFELGLFEQPFVEEDPARLGDLAQEGKELSKELAVQSVTLLKNEGGVLPFRRDVRRIAVIGPHSDSAMVNFANYTYPTTLEMIKGMMSGRSRMVGMENAMDGMPEDMKEAAAERISALENLDLEQAVREQYGCQSLAEAIRQLMPDADVVSVPGTGLLDTDPHDIEAAVAAATSADIVILAIGGRAGAFSGTTTEGEGTDSANIDLPSRQVQLVQAVSALGKPTAAVLYMGRPYGLSGVDDVLPALVTAYYPGPEGAPALANVLFGHSAPSGKLPFSIPRHSGQVPVYQAQKRGSGYRRESIDMAKAYADMPSTPQYAFGHGLSYSSFEYGELRIEPATITANEEVTITIPLRNAGEISSTEIAQLYVGLPGIGITRPAQQLAGFSRVELDEGETAEVSFTVQASQLGHTGRDGRFVVEPGEVSVWIGSASDSLRAHGTFTVLGQPLDVATARSYLPEVRIQQMKPAGHD
ncbi:beta-glucosidase (plasmid) [Arthrobacter sp. G.S.26]|uniref:beta-glucosidase family protein n=1 Tax=Arthrobacter sp. G.S.26 TaxID=3433706 RepID=UPI003D76CD32